MTLPNVQLGNTASDIGSGINTFVTGLIGQRQRQAQIAMQQALNNSKIALESASAQHMGAESALLGEETKRTTAQTGETTARTGLINAQTENAQPISDEEWNVFARRNPNLAGVPTHARKEAIDAWIKATSAPDHYSSVGISPDGKAVGLNTRTGSFFTSGTDLAQKGLGQALNEKLRIGAKNAIAAIDEMEALRRADPNADVKPLATSVAQGLGHIPGIGGALEGVVEPAGVSAMTPTQQQFEGAMSRFAHNAVGLLPGSRQSLTLFNDLRNAYRPKAGESPEGRAAKRAALNQLRARLEELANGKQVDLSDINPAFADLYNPTAHEGPNTSVPSSTQPTDPFAKYDH